jgi:hypothetical protein
LTYWRRGSPNKAVAPARIRQHLHAFRYLAGLITLALSPLAFANIISDEVVYEPQNGAMPAQGFRLDQLIPEGGIGGQAEGLLTAMMVLTWDPSKGQVLPKTVVLTEPGNPDYVSDIMRLTVNDSDTLLTFKFVSDNETSLVPPKDATSIPEAADFMDLTGPLFPKFKEEDAPAAVFVRSADVSVPEPGSMMLIGSAGLAIAGVLSRAGRRRSIDPVRS